MTPPAGMEFDMFGKPPGRMDDPVGVFVLADLTGDGPAPGSMVKLGLDRLDTVMAKLAPRLELAQGQVVEFRELEDFHPDQLCRSVPYINSLRSLLKQLRSTDQFRGAISEMREMGLLVESAPDLPPPAEGPDSDAGSQAEAEPDFARLLGSPAKSPGMPPSYQTNLNLMLGPIVAPHLISGDVSARQTECIDLVSERIAEAIRAILHDERFRSLESRWRGVHWLLSQLDAGAELRCFAFPCTPDQLSQLLGDGSVNLDRVIRDVMETQGLAANRCSLVVDHELSCDESSVALAERLGRLGRTLGVPVFTGASDEVAALREPDADLDQAAAWNRLRQHPDAGSLVTGWPRFLGRYPYGEIGEPIDAFEFEELSDPPDPAEFLWANAAYLLAAAYASQRLGMVQGQYATEEVPIVSFQPDGEMWQVVTTRTAISSPEGLTSATGVCPIVGSKNRSLIVVPWLRSVSA